VYIVCVIFLHVFVHSGPFDYLILIGSRQLWKMTLDMTVGAVNVRTHTSARVVNRASRFHRSAGLEDIGFHSSSGRESPCNASASPSSSPGSVSLVYLYVDSNIYVTSILYTANPVDY